MDLLNFYSLHSEPTNLNGYNIRHRLVPKLAYEAAYFRGSRYPEVESAVLRDPYYAYMYAMNIIKGRWPEAEPIIKEISILRDRYQARFLIIDFY